jgi:hypothetical protein
MNQTRTGGKKIREQKDGAKRRYPSISPLRTASKFNDECKTMNDEKRYFS